MHDAQQHDCVKIVIQVTMIQKNLSSSVDNAYPKQNCEE